MWKNTDQEIIMDEIQTGYVVRYIQYRNSERIMPYQNKIFQKTIETKTISLSYTENSLGLHHPIYKQSCTFWIKADIASDVYYLFAMDSFQQPIFYQYCLIPNYQTSIWMNSLFRNIKENKHLDYIEDSEDEEEFENIKEDKYVFLDRILKIECVFNWKFKRWVPIKINQNGCIPSLDLLIQKKHPSNVYPKNGRHSGKPFTKPFRR
jgi:hypothetical protein